MPNDTVLLPHGGAGETDQGPGDTVPGYALGGPQGRAPGIIPGCGAENPVCLPDALGLGGEWFHQISFGDGQLYKCFNDPVNGNPYMSAGFSFTLYDALRLKTLGTTALLVW